MGCGASVAKPNGNDKNSPTSADQKRKTDKLVSGVPNLMASLQGHGNNQNNDEDTTVIHVIDIVDGSFSGKSSKLRIECDNIVEFKINGKEEYDIIQVFKDGNDYYPVNHGYKLLNLKNRTLPKQRRFLFSYDLNQPELELYFCVIPTSQRDSIARARKYPRIHCEKNCLKLYQNDIKFHLTDEKQSQKVYMHQTDTIQIEWISQIPYRIEEKKYCPVSGGLYTVEATSAKKSNRFSTKGSFMKTFNELGMSFLIRYTETNEIHDVIICIVNEKYKMKHIEITDESIQPNVLWIEKADWLVFDWNTKRKQTVIQIEPFTVDKNSKQSIELKTPGKHFSWPNDATRRGYMVHQFNETGVFCFKTANNQIGTIVVEARQTIHQVPIFHEQLVHKMNTNSLVEFNWTMDPTDEKTILFTLDTYSSVPTQAVEGAQGVFNCASHKCLRADPIFQRYLYTCETLLLNIPQHGLYNFVYSEDQNTPLISIIVENDIDKHTVVYNENDVFEPATLIINRNDQVWFEPSLSVKVETIYETNEFGDELVPDRPIFRPQEKSVNFFMKSFPDMGIYYFSMDKTDKDSDEKTHPLAIIVLSDVRFHYKTVGNDRFDNQAIITNVNDFIIWEFEQIISHNVAYVQPNDTLQDLISCHERAVQGRNRQCLAVECTQSGTFFFANPEFERVTGSVEDRLIATVIVEPQYSQHTVMVDRRGFIPDVLNIAEKETVSWILANPAQNDRIYIRSADNDDDEIVQNELVHRDITKFVHNVHHLHTFHKSGEYIIRSNRFQTIANVFVYSEDMIKSQKKRVPPPQFNEDIDTLSSKGARVHLTCPNRYANIFYTLDGKTPTQHSSNVHTYDDDEGVILNEEGLHVIRAYATEKQKVSSSIVTSSPTFVMDSRELPQVTPEPIPREEEVLHGVQNTRAPPSSYQVMLSLALENPNKVYGNIEIEPANYIDNIDYFELYIDNVPQREHIASDDPHFSASGFAGGEQYQVYVVAHPKANVPDRKQITSNNRAFEIKRETQGGAPLISLGVSKEQNELVLMWAHIKDPVSEYNVYVNGTRTHTLHKENFDEAYRIHFQDVEQDRKYAIYVEAKMQRNNEIRKSNVISVTSPLPMTVNETMIKENFPYIIIKNEQKVDDSHAENIETEVLPTRREESITQPGPTIVGDIRSAAPAVSYKTNPNGITLFWKKPPSSEDSVANYRVVVDKKQYGDLISVTSDPKIQVNLTRGKHECYLETIPKDENEDTYTSIILKVEIEHGSESGKGSSEKTNENVVDENDLPIPKLNVQEINATSIRTNWYLDRPIPPGVCVALYEVHVRGSEFSENVTSDESSKHGSYTEHIWNLSKPPLEIHGLIERCEYTVFVRALLLDVQGKNSEKYLKTTSNEVKTKKLDHIIDLLTRPILQVTRLGIQSANLAWKLDHSVDPSLVKGYRIILNSRPTEMLPANEHEYELRNLKSGSTNDVQVSVTSHPDFIDEKISEPIRIICPKRPQPPKIQAVTAEKPFSIRIRWESDHHEHDDITCYRTYLDGQLHGQVEINGRESFKYEFTKLDADQEYTIHVKSVLGHKRLDGNRFQCDIESKISNELVLQCAAPPRGTPPRIEFMHPGGVDIVWDEAVEHGDVKLTGYQILKDGRSIGKALPVNKRRTSIHELDEGNRYAIQVVPITDQPGGILFRKGEEYDADRHGHYLPSGKLDVYFTDLIKLPEDIQITKITGHSGILCWTSVDDSTSSNAQPDSYKISVWKNKDLTQDKPMVLSVTKDKTSAELKDLESNTTYEIQLEASKKRRHPTTNDLYTVYSTSDIVSFTTGSPPDPPLNLHLIACTNTDARIGFDSFVEHDAEIKALRVLCEPASSGTNAKENTSELMPDSTEFILTNLTACTNYNVTLFAITDEYLIENRCRDVKQLPKKLKPSEWLPYKSFQFQTSGCEPSDQIKVLQANIESIQLEWNLAKVYGSTECLYHVLRYQLEHGGQEQKLDLDRNTTKATIPGPLPSGTYKIALDTIFSVKVNLEDETDETGRKESRLTSHASASVRFHAPGTCEQPEIYLTGYSMNTIDLMWNKPGMFDTVDHPERNNEQLKIHRRLLGYRIDVNGQKYNTLDENQCQCKLTSCRPGEEYKVQLTAQTIVQNENETNMITDGKEKVYEPDETPSKILRVRTLKSQTLLQSCQVHFEFNHDDLINEFSKQKNGPTSLGKLIVDWKVSSTKDISHFVLQWRSSKDLRIQEKTIACNETSATIEPCDEKHFYVIDLIIVTNDGNRHQYEQLTVPIPGIPDAPKVWLVKTTDTGFTIEWSEPKSYGIQIIGYQIYIEGKKSGDVIETNSRQVDIPSRINRTYQINIYAITNNSQRSHSVMSQTLNVITTPKTNLTPAIYYNNDDGGPTSFDQTVARIIPVQIDSVNEEKLHIDWTSFLHTPAIRAYYIHYTCLNNGEVQAMKISKRYRHAVLRGLRPGFTYGIMVMAVDKNGAVLYTSDKSTVQMNAPPNAPIVAISERTYTHVKLEWRPAASYGEIAVVGYKIFVNNRLAAILSHDQLTYTLTNGTPCDMYTVHVQALSNEKTVVSPMSRAVQFVWPGVRPGAFKRIDDGQTGAIVVAWEHPKLEDETEKIIGYRLYSENVVNHAVRLHGEYDANTTRATINGLNNGKHIIWLEIQSENHCIRSRPIIVQSGRFPTLSNRQSLVESSKCYNKKLRRFQSPATNKSGNSFRHTQLA